MLHLKRSLLILVGLLCVLAVTACGNAASPAAQADTATVIPTAAPQKTAEAVKVQSQGKQDQQKQKDDPKKDQAQGQTKTQGNGYQQPTQNDPGTVKKTQPDMPGYGDQNGQDQGMKNNNGNTNTNANKGGPTIVGTTQVNINGQMMTVLTNGNGLSLYYRSSDPAPGSTCTGQCAQEWPPFLSQGNIIPTDNFQGQLTVHATINGNQVEYNGHPLYTYAGDNTKGQLNGHGLGGVWNAATVLPARQHW